MEEIEPVFLMKFDLEYIGLPFDMQVLAFFANQFFFHERNATTKS